MTDNKQYQALDAHTVDRPPGVAEHEQLRARFATIGATLAEVATLRAEQGADADELRELRTMRDEAERFAAAYGRLATAGAPS